MFDVKDIKNEVSKELQEKIGLTETDIEKLNRSLDLVKTSHKYAQVFRTDTEARVSVLNDIKHPTPDAKYWQAIRELKVQSNELFLLNFDYKMKVIDRDELKQKVEFETDNEFEWKRNKLKLEKTEYELLQMELIAKDRIREVDMWRSIIEEIQPAMRFSREDVNEHQLLSYGNRFISEYVAALKMRSKASPAEARNIMGLLTSTLNKISRDGKMDQFLKISSPEVKNFLVENKLIEIENKQKK